MKALVTGATGFVGSHLVEALRRAGDEVTALARSPGKAAGARPARRRASSQGDLRRRGGARARGRGPGRGLPRGGRGRRARRGGVPPGQPRRHAPTWSPRRRGHGAAALRLRLVDGGGRPGARAGTPLTGDRAAAPVTAYGRSKLAAEQAVVTRASCPGPSSGRRRSTARATARCSRSFSSPGSGVAPVFGDGTQELSAVHGADLADALVAAGGGRRDRGPHLLRLPPRGLHQRRLRAGDRRGDGPARADHPACRPGSAARRWR